MNFRNDIELIGNIGDKSKMKTLSNGMELYIFDLFTNDEYIDKNGEKQSTPERHRIKAYGKTASLIRERCEKGDTVLIKGRLTYHEYENGDRVAEIRCEQFMQLIPISYKITIFN